MQTFFWLVIFLVVVALAIYVDAEEMKSFLKIGLAVLAVVLAWTFLSWVESMSTGHPNAIRWAFGYGVSSRFPELSITKVEGAGLAAIAVLSALLRKD